MPWHLVKSIGKSIGVKVSPILFAKVSVLVSAILSAKYWYRLGLLTIKKILIVNFVIIND